MEKNLKEEIQSCCSLLEAIKCNGCAQFVEDRSAKDSQELLVEKSKLAELSSSSDQQKSPKLSGLNDEHGKESELITNDMGCHHSTSLPLHPQDQENGDPFESDVPGSCTERTYERDEKKDSSGDEDLTPLDRAGRQTASDADLINVQRSEETDVTAVLENRWLRSHFSSITPLPTDQAARGSRNFDEANATGLGNEACDTAVNKQFNLYEGVIDLKDQKSITVSCTTQASSGHGPPNDVARHLSVLHFNDVYELTERRKEPVGGASRFSTLFEKISEQAAADCNGQQPFIAFGGDCLNPSILSSATKGKHMVDVLNHLKINAAVFGNHEFDFGVDHAAACTQKMNFPWFLSNVTDKLTEKPLANGVTHQIIEWGGFKIGIVGLIEEEWLDTLATVDKCELSFEDYVTRGRKLTEELKVKGADLVIALTHMRWPNDIRLAREVTEIDLILGGHDHEYGVRQINDCVIVKSGCDFQTFSRIDLYFKKEGDMDVSVTRCDVTKATEENPEMKTIVQKYMTVLEEQLKETIGTIKIDLDGLYKEVRTKETNLGNFVADIMRMTTRAEIVLINSGTFRSNAIHTSGKFRIRDLMSILPIHDNVVVIEVTGQQLLDGLENAVSKYPLHEGRFPQISGFCFGFDPKAPTKQRVVRGSVLIRGKPLVLNQVYKLATKAYVARGRDGYECFSNCRLLNDPDTGPVLSTVVRNHISNVFHLLKYEEMKGKKIRVIEDGKKIISDGGDLHEVYSSCFWDVPPVDKLQKSMEDIVPKDINDNEVLDRNGLRKTSDSNSDEFDGLQESRTPHMQHLIEIGQDRIFDNSATVSDPITRCRQKAILENRDNLELLTKRQNDSENVHWQVFPLLEGRIFHCSTVK